MEYKRPNFFLYHLTRFFAGIVSRLTFKRKFIRNELRGKKGPAVVIANHQCKLDFINLFGATKRRMSFVISNTFYNTLPIRGILRRIGVIPKQQFQTALNDVHAMKAVVDSGEILVLYPAGLMCEDGKSTPIPEATWRFLQFLRADVYVARSYGAYFCVPKWSDKKRPGKTLLDVYKLADSEELGKMSAAEWQSRAETALSFDAYREQDELKIKYKNSDIEGLENVLYKCPECGKDFTLSVRDKNTLVCESCGLTHVSDEYGMLECTHGSTEFRYVSDFADKIYAMEREELLSGSLLPIVVRAKVQTIDYKKKRFVDIGEGVLTVDSEKITLVGTLSGAERKIELDSRIYPSLPFSPGKHIELQDGDSEYRLYPEDGRLAMKIINAVKILHAEHVKPKEGTN